jgi:addiction module HigA family antidote
MAMREDMIIHPGEVLREEFLAPYGLSANRLAQALKIPTNRITEIMNGRRGVTGETAVLLAHAFGTTAEFWLNLQTRYELDRATHRLTKEAVRSADAFAKELAVA